MNTLRCPHCGSTEVGLPEGPPIAGPCPDCGRDRSQLPTGPVDPLASEARAELAALLRLLDSAGDRRRALAEVAARMRRMSDAIARETAGRQDGLPFPGSPESQADLF